MTAMDVILEKTKPSVENLDIRTSAPSAPNKLVLDSPVGDARISSKFGAARAMGSSPHRGTDYAIPIGTPVRATADGVVSRAYLSKSYGNTVILNHGAKGNIYTLYAHGSSLNVVSGQSVRVGDIIMMSGNTGLSSGPHLHYEVIRALSITSKGFFNNFNNRYFPSALKGLLEN